VGAIFATVRGLFQQRLSPDATAGLPRIAGAAFQAAQAGFDTLMQFLGMLSINLAVINFLPIPPLDGGQMVLLAGEKLRGKPLPEKAVLAVTMAGAAMLLLLIGFSLLNDFRHIFFRG
jgi:regulator of sigma E protease